MVQAHLVIKYLFTTVKMLSKLAKVLEKHPHVYVVADEIYEHINFSGNFCSIIYPGVRKNRYRWVLDICHTWGRILIT
jgi:bifunctional pyridoxal-dependent enzyme with beta-cystathionase and maltose regulon repressor activities